MEIETWIREQYKFYITFGDLPPDVLVKKIFDHHIANPPKNEPCKHRCQFLGCGASEGIYRPACIRFFTPLTTKTVNSIVKPVRCRECVIEELQRLRNEFLKLE